MPQGERPQMPNGEQVPPPEMQDGMERPEKQNGEIPQGERPEKPDDMIPPDNKGGIMGGAMVPRGEISTTFTITKGGNLFSNVAQAAS